MIVYAILAAGLSRRMGFAKAVAPLGSRSPLARIAATLDGRAFVVVTNGAQVVDCAQAVSGATILVNPEPLRGMTSSLRIANDAIDPAAHLGVLLADKPFLSVRTLLECEDAAPRYDIVFPVSSSGQAGHPVLFSPHARARLGDLPDGDTLRILRDAPLLKRLQFACADDGAFTDLDTIEDWQAAEMRHGT